MEVNGQQFIQNVELEADKIKLEEKKQKLDSKKVQSVKNTPYNDLSLNPDISLTNELTDVALPPKESLDNKKKYILLGFILVIVFITALVITRIISNKNQENQIETIIPQTQEIKQEETLDKIETEEEYSKVIQQKQTLNIDQPEIKQESTVQEELQLPEPIKEKPPVEIIQPKPTKQKIKKDLFELEKKRAKKEIKKVTKKKIKQATKQKKIVIPAPKVKDLDKKVKSTTKLSGYYIQISAVTRKPTKKYLNNISKKGYKYAVYPITIKGKKFNKILIGSYKTKSLAKKVLPKIKKDFKNPHAYIIRF